MSLLFQQSPSSNAEEKTSRGQKRAQKPRDKIRGAFVAETTRAARREEEEEEEEEEDEGGGIGKNNYNYIYKEERTRCLNRA